MRCAHLLCTMLSLTFSSSQLQAVPSRPERDDRDASTHVEVRMTVLHTVITSPHIWNRAIVIGCALGAVGEYTPKQLSPSSHLATYSTSSWRVEYLPWSQNRLHVRAPGEIPPVASSLWRTLTFLFRAALRSKSHCLSHPSQ